MAQATNNEKPITRPLCLECGEEKSAPLAACPQCAHQPTENEDCAKHMLLATYEFTLTGLKQMQEALRHGQRPEFHPDSMMTMQSALKANKPDAHWLLFWVFFAVPIAAVLVYVIYSIIKGGPEIE